MKSEEQSGIIQDKVIPFTKKEFDIVELLTRNSGQIFDKEKIYGVYGENLFGENVLVQTPVYNIFFPSMAGLQQSHWRCRRIVPLSAQ